MKTIIAGSRSFKPERALELVEEAVWKCGWKVTSVNCGCAPGIDKAGGDWARANVLPVSYMPADWEAAGKKAGILRNVAMLKEAQAVIVIWDGKSPGSEHMLTIAKKSKKPLHVVIAKEKK